MIWHLLHKRLEKLFSDALIINKNLNDVLLHQQMLLEAGAPVSDKDCNDNEPIHLAAKAGSKNIIHLLKQYGGYVCSPGIGPFFVTEKS